MFNWSNLFSGGAKPGAGGWNTNVTTGSGKMGLDALMNPLVRDTQGQVTGLSDPFMKTMGGAFQAAGSAMPGGGAFAQSQPQKQTEPTYAPRAPVASATPQSQQGRQPSWIESLFG